MEFTLKYKVPREYTEVDGDATLTINVEVLGLNTPQQTCFLTKVSGNGIIMLWGIKPCAALFDDVQRQAIAMAKQIDAEPVKFKAENQCN